MQCKSDSYMKQFNAGLGTSRASGGIRSTRESYLSCSTRSNDEEGSLNSLVARMSTVISSSTRSYKIEGRSYSFDLLVVTTIEDPHHRKCTPSSINVASRIYSIMNTQHCVSTALNIDLVLRTTAFYGIQDQCCNNLQDLVMFFQFENAVAPSFCSAQGPNLEYIEQVKIHRVRRVWRTLQLMHGWAEYVERGECSISWNMLETLNLQNYRVLMR